MKPFISLLLLFTLSSTVFTWSWPAHVVIYMIARNELGWDELDFVDELIEEVDDPSANYPNVFEIAGWADEAKNQDDALFNGNAHFFNQLYYDGVSPNRVRKRTDYENNVVQALIESMKVLKSSRSSRIDKSYMMRYLIHMVGDMHQPLHVSTRCTPDKLLCDAGGNSFKIDAGEKTQDLHALWDQVMKKFPFSRRPLSKASIDMYKDFAKDIVKEYPRSALSEELSVTDPWEMAKDIFDIAVQYAYTNIKEGEEPTDGYIESRYLICEKLIALAGYRLADYIEDAFNANQ